MSDENKTLTGVENTLSVPDYTSYPREFTTYRWFRPIITGVLFIVFNFIFQVVLILALSFASGDGFTRILEISSGGYDSFDVHTALGVLVTLGSAAVMIPALALANRISGGRTFRSYSSSRGGWDYQLFFRCLAIALIVIAVPVAVYYIFVYGRVNPVMFTLPGIILLTILGPMQCIAEEYAFRGILMQTVGSWIKFPPLAIVLSAAVFASMHPYNKIGVAEIFISGCIFGFVAWRGHGIEVSSALHIANNMAIFYCVGFGFGQIKSEETVGECAFSVVIYVIYAAVIFFLSKKGFFDKVKRNDAAEWNARVTAKQAEKTGQDDAVIFVTSDEPEVNAEEDR
jgi:membrane protease YdiL (CAAX protease family)